VRKEGREGERHSMAGGWQLGTCTGLHGMDHGYRISSIRSTDLILDPT